MNGLLKKIGLFSIAITLSSILSRSEDTNSTPPLSQIYNSLALEKTNKITLEEYKLLRLKEAEEFFYKDVTETVGKQYNPFIKFVFELLGKSIYTKLVKKYTQAEFNRADQNLDGKIDNNEKNALLLDINEEDEIKRAEEFFQQELINQEPIKSYKSKTKSIIEKIYKEAIKEYVIRKSKNNN